MGVVTWASLMTTFARSRRMQAIVACVAIGIGFTETAVGSFSQESNRHRQPLSVLDDRMPISAIKMAILTLEASPIENGTVSTSQMESSCKSFEFSFLNPSCSRKRKKIATRAKHRVATFVAARFDPSPPSTTANLPFATKSEGTIPDRTANVEETKREMKASSASESDNPMPRPRPKLLTKTRRM